MAVTIVENSTINIPTSGRRFSSSRRAVHASWQYAGEWYTAGSNTCVHSRPAGDNFSPAELAPTEHNVITSNRRWREEEFLIPRHLTEGVERLRIRIDHVPDTRPLYPGHPFPVENAWSESRYLDLLLLSPSDASNSKVGIPLILNRAAVRGFSSTLSFVNWIGFPPAELTHQRSGHPPAWTTPRAHRSNNTWRTENDY